MNGCIQFSLLRDVSVGEYSISLRTSDPRCAGLAIPAPVSVTLTSGSDSIALADALSDRLLLTVVRPLCCLVSVLVHLTIRILFVNHCIGKCALVERVCDTCIVFNRRVKALLGQQGAEPLSGTKLFNV